MKTLLTFSLLLLFVISGEAQSLKSGLTKTVATINGILEQKKMVRFTNRDYEVFYPAKINANLQGDVFCVESSSGYATKSSGIIFNVLEVASYVLNGDELKALDKDQQTVVAIFQGSLEGRQTLIKELEALRFICTAYSKEDPKFKCD
jgi:hypothetical protein